MDNGLNIQEKLLIAAAALEAQGRSRFSAEDLVVTAWRKYPDAFGLAGYTDDAGLPLYPNSNRVYAEIMGSKPLRKNGWLRKVGSKMYQLTEAGRAQARNVATRVKDSVDTPVEKWTLGREQVEFVRRLFESRAAKKVRAGELDAVSFFDAAAFWGISAASNANDLRVRFADIEAVLSKAERSLASREIVQVRHGSVQFAMADLKGLKETHALLQDRFAPELAVIMARTDER